MRTVTLATTSMSHPTLADDEVRPDGPEAAFAEAEPLIGRAADQGADFLCLPELFANFGRSQPAHETAEEVEGPINGFLRDQARKHRINLVTTVALIRNGAPANTAVIYSRDGELVGTYDKVHLAPGEERHMRRGTAFPVVEVEGVRVGMQICFDLNFPEGCRVLAVKGADVIFWPNLWGGMPEDYTDVILRARAMENLVCLVSSGCFLEGDTDFRTPKIFPRSCVVDPNGTILAEVGRHTGLAVAGVDLDSPRVSQAEKAEIFGTHRQPHLYGELCR